MTEEQWLDPRATAQGLALWLQKAPAARSKAGRRKLRMFACAGCRLFWEHLCGEQRDAVEVVERFAEGLAARAELDEAYQKVQPIGAGSPDMKVRLCRALSDGVARPEAPGVAYAVACYGPPLAGRCGRPDGDALLVLLLRDVFGNPFRKTKFDKKWRTGTAVALARQMYESRDFGAMPILADALQDAGCEEAAILAHCRDTNQPHVRGCWVVDLVLGKS